MAEQVAPHPWRDVAVVTGAALAATLAIAAPVLVAPSERIFGTELVGRNHDPFTVMAQFSRPFTLGIYSQPVTDLTGAALAKVLGPVPAYNVLILLSFPLAAVAAWLLARQLGIDRAGSAVASAAFAFSPFHLAHAAYHPHIAQVQWIPLYLLALWRCLDRPTVRAQALLAAAAAAVVLSNYYGGLIAATVTPVALAARHLAAGRRMPGAAGRLLATAGGLALIAAVGTALLWRFAPAVLAGSPSLAFARQDLFRYGAKWWGYLVPPLANPLLGGVAQAVWDRARVGGAVLEQQVFVGWGILALGAVALSGWRSRDRGTPALSWVPVLAVVAAWALLCSLSPERRIAGFTFVRPSALLYGILPMFRAYARFGVVVQLMGALAAGIGVQRLLASGSRRARIACGLLLLVAAAEYLPWPPALWRDVLPTRAHRFVAEQAGPMQVLDCVKPSAAEASVPWLTGKRLSFLGGALGDCAAPDFPAKAASRGYTHLIVRRDSAAGRWYARHGIPPGLVPVAAFPDGDVYAVAAPGNGRP